MKKKFKNYIFRSTWRLVAVALVAVAVACSEDVPEPTPDGPETPEVPEAPEEPAPVQGGRSRNIELTAQQQGFVDATIDMSFKMFEALNLQEREVEALESVLERPVDNIVFSPLGASYAAMALANGAAGDSQSQILTALGFEGHSIEEVNEYYRFLSGELSSLDPNSKFKIANSIWFTTMYIDCVKAAYVKTMQDYYEAPTTVLDNFDYDDGGVVINDWGRQATEGFLDHFFILGSLETPMALTNILYFRGGWVWPFDEKETKDAVFHNEDGTESTVKMMTLEKRTLRKVSSENYLALRLPYGNEAFCMTLILPRVEIDKCIEALRNDVKPLTLLAKDNTQPDDHRVFLPRFDITYRSIRIAGVMSYMGAKDAFDPDKADLSGMFDLERAKIVDKGNNPHGANLIQTCRIAVDERKTEAASGAYVLGHSGIVDEENIVFDRPFLFLISERSTGIPLFMGRVTKL